jgi:hypothetical protein
MRHYEMSMLAVAHDVSNILQETQNREADETKWEKDVQVTGTTKK